MSWDGWSLQASIKSEFNVAALTPTEVPYSLPIKRVMPETIITKEEAFNDVEQVGPDEWDIGSGIPTNSSTGYIS